ncbi:MAG: MBL fold metallo-hydrolase [Pseudonocardiaceae bacterium]
MQIVHFGQSCVLAEAANARLLIDPGVYSSGFEELTGLDAILVTHQHPDHLDIHRLPALMAANPAAELVADPGSAPLLAEAGLDHRVVRPGEQLKLADTTVDVIGGEHGVIHPDIPVVPNNGYLIDGGAGTILHPGDSFTLSGTDTGDIDVLLLPTVAPWFKLSEAVDYLRAVDPGLAVPIHQATLARPEKFYGFLRELAPTGTEVHVVTQGEALTL